MTKDLSDVTACVIDRGTFFAVALRLARDCKRVLYHIPNGEQFETFAANCRGDGFSKVEYVSDFWPHKSDIDLFVFPDCTDAGLQAELVGMGYPVWGSRNADRYEKYRGVWVKTCQELGLPMPETAPVVGIANLRSFLREHAGQEYFVKASRFRGDMETWHASSPAQIENKLDLLALRFGPFQDKVTFYIQEPVKTKIEGGTDTYSIDGQYPGKVVLGYEKKDEAYFATWKPTSEMPEEIWGPSNAIAPLLKSLSYRNMVSTEVRVGEDGESYLLDPCLRFPSPAGEEQLELYANASDIIWQGAQGTLVEPEMTARYCGEALIHYCGDPEGWRSIRVSKELQPWVKLYACASDGDTFSLPPGGNNQDIGCAIGLGDTPEEVLSFLKDISEELKAEPVEVKFKPLADLFSEIEEAETQGIEFGNETLPDADEVLAEKG